MADVNKVSVVYNQRGLVPLSLRMSWAKVHLKVSESVKNGWVVPWTIFMAFISWPRKGNSSGRTTHLATRAGPASFFFSSFFLGGAMHRTTPALRPIHLHNESRCDAGFGLRRRINHLWEAERSSQPPRGTAAGTEGQPRLLFSKTSPDSWGDGCGHALIRRGGALKEQVQNLYLLCVRCSGDVRFRGTFALSFFWNRKPTRWEESADQKVRTIPAGPQTLMSSSARVALQRPVRFQCIFLSSVPASTVPMKLCLIGRIFSIIATASIYQSVHRFVYSCRHSPKKTAAGSARSKWLMA